MRSIRVTAADGSARTPTRCTDPDRGHVTPRVGRRAVEHALHAIEHADLLIVASPVYRASFTGLFTHLFDFVGQCALVGTPVFFQALTLPVGVYASDTDFDGYELTSEAVKRRIDQAVTRSLPLVSQAAGQRVSEYVATW